MSYKRVERIYCPLFSHTEACAVCPTRKLIATMGNTAVAELKGMPGVEERPDYADARREYGFWITKESDARLRAENPEYATTIGVYDAMKAQWTDMDKNCTGGIVDRPPEGQATHTCHYEPPIDIPDAPTMGPWVTPYNEA